MQSQRELAIKQAAEELTKIEALGFRLSIIYEHPEWQEVEAAWITEPLNPEDVLLPITRLKRRFEDINKRSEKVTDERMAVKDVRSKWGHLVDHLPENLQPEAGKFSQELLRPGMAYGLGCTNHVGGLVSIETVKIPGRGRLILTGGKQEDTKESARIALSYVAANAHRGIGQMTFRRYDIHVHSPGEGASAGVAIVIALISLLTGQPSLADIAYTGTVSLSGEIGSVGGVKEKIFGAFEAGIKTIFLPKGNEHSLSDVPLVVRKEMKFILVDAIDAVIRSQKWQKKGEGNVRNRGKEKEVEGKYPDVPEQGTGVAQSTG